MATMHLLSDDSDGSSDEGQEDGGALLEEDEVESPAEKLKKYYSGFSSRSIGRLAFLALARMPFNGNQSLVLNGGNARIPDTSGNRHRGIGDCLIAAGDEGRQLEYQTAVVSIQMAVRPDTELGDKLEEIGCVREMLATGESVKDNSEDATSQLERVEGREEWVMAPMNRYLMQAGAEVLAGRYDEAEATLRQAKPSDRELTFESLKTDENDLLNFIAETHSADFTHHEWIEMKGDWLTNEELASIDRRQADDSLSDDDARALTLAMILARHLQVATEVFNKMVCDFYGVEVDDNSCTAKYTVSDYAN